MESLTNPPLARQFELMTSAQHLRRYATLERRLFEVVGQWVPQENNVPAKLQYGQQCYRHVRRAEQLEALLPTPAEQYPAAYGVTVDVAVLTPVEVAADTTSRMEGLYTQVLTTMVADYRQHLARTNLITDGPTIAILTRIISEVLVDLDAGQALLATL